MINKAFTRGIFLLFFSFVYIVTLKLFFNVFPELVWQFGMPITIFYLAVFFIEGLRIKEKPTDGFTQGFIGSLFGVFVSSYGLIQYSTGASVAEVERLLEAWNLPFIGLTPYFNFEEFGLIQPLGLQFLSLLLLIGLTFIGGLIGSVLNKNTRNERDSKHE